MDEASVRKRVGDRLAEVEARIGAACRRAGRPREEVTLVAVTKTVTPAVAALLPGLGVRNLGENRPQELWRKAEQIAGVHWHLIGHLQRNKIERSLPLLHLVHSVDSLRLLSALDEACAQAGRAVSALLEVNASGEETKQGFEPAEMPGLVPALLALRQVRVEGMMTMAAPEADPQACRPTFVRLREIRDQLQKELGDRHRLAHLSMGMSNDFEIAIEEGATLIRLGTVLLGGLDGLHKPAD